MPVKGSTITFSDVEKLFAKVPVADLRETELFVTGDHWQGGAGWKGWEPESASEGALKQFALVERLFNAKNVCGGMVSRIRGAALGKEPDWEIVPRNRSTPAMPQTETTPPVRTEKDGQFLEIDKSLVRWWDEKQVHKYLKEFISNKASYGKSAIRIHIPKGYLKANGDKKFLTVKDLDDALDKIFITVPHYANIIDSEDADFGTKYTVMREEKRDDADLAEPLRYEVGYIAESGETVLRQVTETSLGQPQKPSELALTLGGNLLTHVVGEYREAIISTTVKHQQRAVNHAKTGENFALANINFPETTFINADLPTDTVEVGGKIVDRPKEMAQGAGRWRSLLGLRTMDATGGERITTPDVRWRDGADPERFARVAANNTRDMHQEAGMLYIYLADSEYASGDARIEAMTDYLILLVDSKTLIDNTGHWLLTTVLRLAYNLLGQKDKIDSFEVIFSSNLTIGRVSNEDKAIMLQEVQAGLRSQRNYIIKCEVSDDPTSELMAIAVDPPLKNAQPNAIEVANASADAQIRVQQATPQPAPVVREASA